MMGGIFDRWYYQGLNEVDTWYTSSNEFWATIFPFHDPVKDQVNWNDPSLMHKYMAYLFTELENTNTDEVEEVHVTMHMPELNFGMYNGALEVRDIPWRLTNAHTTKTSPRQTTLTFEQLGLLDLMGKPKYGVIIPQPPDECVWD